MFVLFSVPLSVGPVLTLSEGFVCESDLLHQNGLFESNVPVLDLC